MLPTITFDIDGVWANFTKKFCDLLYSDSGVKITPDWPTTEPLGTLLTAEQWKRGWELVAMTPYFWATIEPYADCPFTTVESLMTEGLMTGYFVSMRPHTNSLGSDARFCTRIWLEGFGIHSAQGVIVGTDFNRTRLLKSLGCNAHLDDQANHIDALTKAGMNAYLLDRPWNQHYKIDPEHRVCSIDQFLERAVAPLLSEHSRKSYFGPAQQTDLCHPGSTRSLVETAISTGLQVSALAEKSTPRPA